MNMNDEMDIIYEDTLSMRNSNGVKELFKEMCIIFQNKFSSDTLTEYGYK
jgi:hypothetical protein